MNNRISSSDTAKTKYKRRLPYIIAIIALVITALIIAITGIALVEVY